jgi:tRNA-binding EMAP/Myf-like protein
MERKLASIQRIVSLSPIEGADRIQKCVVLGWELVVAVKDNFNVGDLVVYCEVDSILPDKPEFEFLRERKFRIKTIKLKGQVSQGICFSLSILPKGKYKEGDDVTEILGVTKYDPQAEFERKESLRLASIDKNRMTKFLKRYSWYRNLFFKPPRIPFPSFIHKTDEDRIQLFPHACEEWKGIPFTVTEKIDGQSGTYFCIPNPKKGLFQPKWLFGVCSRNFQLLKEDNSSYWAIAKQLSLKDKMIEVCNRINSGIIIQGEIIGSKIQGNKYNRDGFEFFVFNFVLYNKGEYASLDQESQCIYCGQLGLQVVPVTRTHYFLPSTIHEIVEFAKGSSVLNDVRGIDIPREGVVMRNYDRNISFKAINSDFLLQYSE